MITYESRANALYIESRRMLVCRPHFHPDLECIWMRRGTVKARADTHTYVVGEGDFFLTFPNQIHSFSQDSSDEESLILIVPLSMCSEYKMLLRQNTPRCNRIPADRVPPELPGLMSQMEAVSGPYAAGICKGYWLIILGMLLPCMALEPSQENESDVLRSLLNYCMEHLNDELSLERVAAQVCVGKYYISHLFRKRLGIGFHEYVNLLRVNEAGKLLLETDLSVTEIGDRVGFASPRTFNRVFRDHTMTSPREYRQKGGVLYEGRL